MSLADELEKLQVLREDGTLTDAEFAQAKAKLLAETSSTSSNVSSTNQDLIGRAAMTWVSFRIVMSVVGLILAAILFFTFFLPLFMRGKVGFP